MIRGQWPDIHKENTIHIDGNTNHSLIAKHLSHVGNSRNEVLIDIMI